MTLINGIGDEVTYFFFCILAALVVLLAWFTTNISEQRYVQTAVLLVDGRRHRAHQLTRLTNHTQALSVTEDIPSSSNISTSDNNNTPVSTSMESTTCGKPPGSSDTNSEDRSEEEIEQTTIVAAMDDDTFVLRQRRLAFYEKSGSSATNGSSAGQSSSHHHHHQFDGQEESNSNQTIIKHSYTESGTTNDESSSENMNPPSSSSDIRIKLKYINDDLKLVHGNLHEQLGDFKKRLFQAEFTANKRVRLIFNGQVLQQDTKTLQNCGLFDNCVVHCLVHPKRSGHNDETVRDSQTDNVNGESNWNLGNINNNQNQGRDWDFSNFLFALISFTLLSAWYFRFVYPHLYTVLATGGLILITGIFSFVVFGVYFPQQDNAQQRPRENLVN